MLAADIGVEVFADALARLVEAFHLRMMLRSDIVELIQAVFAFGMAEGDFHDLRFRIVGERANVGAVRNGGVFHAVLPRLVILACIRGLSLARISRLHSSTIRRS